MLCHIDHEPCLNGLCSTPVKGRVTSVGDTAQVWPSGNTRYQCIHRLKRVTAAGAHVWTQRSSNRCKRIPCNIEYACKVSALHDHSCERSNLNGLVVAGTNVVPWRLEPGV